MKKTFIYTLFAAICFLLGSCKENYSRGEKVGNLIEFTKKGVIYDSWEGRLNLTQTGMNTSGEPFSFSFDNDRTDQDSLIKLLYRAQVEGWKVQIKYHSVRFTWSSTRTNYATVGRKGVVFSSLYARTGRETLYFSVIRLTAKPPPRAMVSLNVSPRFSVFFVIT